MKKITAFVLAVVMCLTLLAGCGSEANTASGTDAGATKLKIGCILIGDATEGYTKAHIDGIQAAAKALGISDDQIIWKYKVAENSSCYDAACDLVASGCNVIFANSYGHQTYMAQAAEQYPDVTFVSVTGDFAGISGLKNLKNAFTDVYQSRYVAGVVAGLKLQELVKDGKLTDKNYDANKNIKIGYVGAYNYSEVVSGYTAFYLGLKSIVDNVAMEVMYTNSWFDIDKENATAKALIANGCVIIGQHADSTGAPAAAQEAFDNGTIAYSIGYNIDMLPTAPTAALTSASNNWAVYYQYAMQAAMKGETLDTDWAKGYDADAVEVTTLGPSVAEGTADKVNEVIAALKDGSLKVFDTSKFTASPDAQKFCTIAVDGEGHVTSCKEDLSYYDFSTGSPVQIYAGETVEAIVGGAFSESTFRSAPYFNIRINGITED